MEQNDKTFIALPEHRQGELKLEGKMEAYQERVVDEKSELDKKINTLTAFQRSEAFKTIDYDKTALLHRQLKAMVEYSNILNERILLL